MGGVLALPLTHLYSYQTYKQPGIMNTEKNPQERKKQALTLPAVIARLLFWITFKKIPKKQFGRCVTCEANKICYKIKVCKCNDEQQYDLRLNRIVTKVIHKN